MERKKEKSTAFDESVCVLNYELSEMFLKKEESKSTIGKDQCPGSCKPVERIKSFSSTSGCSKSCMYYRENKDRYRLINNFIFPILINLDFCLTDIVEYQLNVLNFYNRQVIQTSRCFLSN